MRIVVLERTDDPFTDKAEMPIREKYKRGGMGKRNAGKSGGNSGSSGAHRNPPTGIRCRPRRRYGN